MTADGLADRLLPLASEHPDFCLEACAKITVFLDGEPWSNYHMPIKTVIGCVGPRVVLLGVDGLHELEDIEPANEGEDPS
jgi:hypothetical protein